MTRPPFLQSRACKMEKAELHLSQNLGRSGGSMPYCSKRVSYHSCAPSSVPFTDDGFTVSHIPVFVTRRKWRATWTRAPARVSSSASSDHLVFRFCTSSLPSLRNAACSAVLNSSWPLSADMRCPVMTQDALQFSGAVSVGYGRARPA